MTAWSDAEEADREAADRAHADEWASEHRHPVQAALQRAQHAEAQRDQAMTALCVLTGVNLDTLAAVGFRPVVAAGQELLRRLERAERSTAQIRDATLREVEANGRFVYETETHPDDLTHGPPHVIRSASRRLVIDGGRD